MSRWPAALLVLAGCAPALRPSPPPTALSGPADPVGSLAAVQALARRLEAAPGAEERRALATEAVAEGQRCDARWPGQAPCDYGLALGLGLQARERPATAAEGLKLMVERLRRAGAAEPALDRGGPARVLALVLVRAPGWPLGPGDAEAGLAEARKAVALSPAWPPNALALAEALRATGAVGEGRAEAARAAGLARARLAAGEPEAQGWLREAERLAAP